MIKPNNLQRLCSRCMHIPVRYCMYKECQLLFLLLDITRIYTNLHVGNIHYIPLTTCWSDYSYSLSGHCSSHVKTAQLSSFHQHKQGMRVGLLAVQQSAISPRI